MNSSMQTLLPEESQQVSRAVNDSQNFDTVEQRNIKNETPLEAVHAKDPKCLKTRIFQSRMPSHVC